MTVGKIHDANAAGLEHALDLLVQDHVCPAKFVDRLLRIADQKQLAGFRCRVEPVFVSRVVRRKQEQQLSLQRVRVLKLVHEDVAEAVLQVFANLGVVPHQVPRENQEIYKIELSST